MTCYKLYHIVLVALCHSEISNIDNLRDVFSSKFSEKLVYQGEDDSEEQFSSWRKGCELEIAHIITD